MTQQLEAGMAQEMLDILARAGIEIVHAQHLRVVFEQALTQVRTEKSGTARHEHPLAIASHVNSYALVTCMSAWFQSRTKRAM